MAPEFSQGMSLNMSQRLEMVMTPQMIQAMEMLQLPLMALEQKINQELLENPALELAGMKEDLDSPVADDIEEPETEPESYEAVDASENLSRIDEIDYDWDSFYEEAAPGRSVSDSDERLDLIENAPGRGLSFPEYLIQQLQYYELDERSKELCTRIIYALDPSGYLTTPLQNLVDQGEDDPAPTMEELESALSVVQSLEPPGVGATSPKECLLLQIEALGSGDHWFEYQLIKAHLDDLAANRLPQIARSMGCDIDTVKRAAAFIRSLNPHPGLEYSTGSITHIQPDIIVELLDDGTWDIRLVSGAQPDVSDMFLALFDSTKRGKQLREKMLADPQKAAEFKQMQEMVKHNSHGRMLREKYQSARWLITAVQQRERTLIRVARAIVDAQKAYLSGQSDAPAPLMMQTVADEVGIDISTVSRAVRDKYMDTPIGLKPLRMFFTRAVGGRRGSKESSNVAIMNRIRDIIQNEDKRKPLKDDQIQALLAQDGIDIKRRTVAKYRANLGFPSHSQRREY